MLDKLKAIIEDYKVGGVKEVWANAGTKVQMGLVFAAAVVAASILQALGVL